jgi:hypothetical protein
MMKIEQQYIIEPAKDGNPSLLVVQDGREIPLHSRINPLKEGSSCGYNFDPERFDFLVILGCGLGYSLIKLKDFFHKFRSVIIIDILPGIENEIAENLHTSFLVQNKNISFFTGMDLRGLDTSLSEIIDFHLIKGVQVIEHPQSVRIFSSYYDQVRLLIKRLIDKKAGDKATIKTFGNVFLRNALHNVVNFKHSLPVSHLAGKFRGRRAVIVSSAPSLEDNIDKLKNYSDKIYIIAVDSVLPVLRSYGVKPDFVISIDPQDRIGEHFLGHDLFDALHIFSIVSPPELVEKYSGYISMNSHPVSQIIEDMYPGVNGSIDSSTGSVAGDAVKFALMAGFEFIAMTGFDFSFSENIIYARETAYQKRYTQYFNNRFKTTETFNAAYIFKSSGALVYQGKYTRRSFVNYRNSLDSFLKDNKPGNIFMINKRGLPLTSAETSDFDSFMSMPCPVSDNKMEYLSEINLEKRLNPINLEKVKERLLDKRVIDAVIEESLGSEVTEDKRQKIVEMIKGII